MMVEKSPYEYSKKVQPTVVRVCLRCNKEFPSQGDRLCRRCNELNQNCSKLDTQAKSVIVSRKPVN